MRERSLKRIPFKYTVFKATIIKQQETISFANVKLNERLKERKKKQKNKRQPYPYSHYSIVLTVNRSSLTSSAILKWNEEEAAKEEHLTTERHLLFGFAQN